MFFFVIMESAAAYRTRNWMAAKLALEDAARDIALVLHYRQLRRDMIDDLNPLALVYSGSSTPFNRYGVLTDRRLRAIMQSSPVAQLGICAGHQVMASIFGSRLAPMGRLTQEDPDLKPTYHPGYFKEWGVFPVRITRAHPLFRSLPRTLRVPEFHRDHVARLGPTLVPLASSPRCPIQAFQHRNHPWYGVQFHPEEATDDYPHGRIILRNFFAIARRHRMNATAH